MNAPLSATTKISDLLGRYPEALDVLLAASPAFHKLKNPLLRKMLGKRVTIEEAAAIGGVRTAELLEAIGTACHADIRAQSAVEATLTTSTCNPSAYPWPPEYNIVTLDVRSDLAENRDPFTRIMKVVKQLGANEVLHLVNSFEPVPLYGVLTERRLAHVTEHSGDEWHVYFYPADAVTPNEGENPDMTPIGDGIIELDVSGLEPPEPMQRILTALGSLPAGTALQVSHHREPLLLYDQLERRGFEWTTTKLAENRYQILIFRSA